MSLSVTGKTEEATAQVICGPTSGASTLGFCKLMLGTSHGRKLQPLLSLYFSYFPASRNCSPSPNPMQSK